MFFDEKTCTRCLQLKPLNDFHLKEKVLGTRHTRCRDCMREIETEKSAKLRELRKKRNELERRNR